MAVVNTGSREDSAYRFISIARLNKNFLLADAQ
jgi:hypothetical protein